MKLKTRISFNEIAITCLIAGLLAGLLCVYQSCIVFNCHISSIVADNFGIGDYWKFFIFFVLVILFCYTVGKENLFRYRFFLAAICLLTCIAFEITGSSIGCFVGEAEQDLLLGVSRRIRSDEWAILTPMTWSQYYDPSGHFSYYSSLIRAEPTDVFLEYGLPIYTPMMVYKPFLLGYLFLPIAKGMSFFWCGRLIALAMTSFEFGRLITKDNRLLSIAYAIMIVFSPCVQWWFAINGFVEMLIFLQLSLICFDKYLKENDSRKRALYAAVIGISAGGYILTMYPAWMVPLAYVLLGCIIWILYENHRHGLIKALNKADVIPILFTVCILVISATFIYIKSHDTFATIMNTAYPGHRFENGGVSSPEHLFSFIPSLWYAVRESRSGIHGNVCECAYFISMFPAGYLLFFNRIAKRKRDALCTIMVIVSTLLMIYCLIELPDIVAKITLLRYSKSNRALVAFGLSNVILLIRIIALSAQENENDETEDNNTQMVAVQRLHYFIMCSIAILGIWTSYQLNAAYYNKYMIIIEIILFIPLYCLLCNQSRRANLIWVVLMVSVCMISSALANPLRVGVDDINASADIKMIRSIVEKDPEAVWMVEGEGFPDTNLPLLAGAKTLNCTNIYPDTNRWSAFDPTGAYEECYNRYAHMQIIRDNHNSTSDKFVLKGSDYYTVYLNDLEIKSLGVNYMLSRNKLLGSNIRLVSTDGLYNVYAIE